MMRPAIVPPKLPIVAKPKLKLPPPRAPFRVHLERAAEPPPPVPMRTPAPSAPAISPRSEPAPKRTAPLEREEPMRELDSAARTATLLAPPPQVTPPPPSHAPAPPTVNVDQQLAIELVEKASFWGDGTRGLARLRFNGRARAGLANATVTLEHDGDETHLRVEGIDPEVEQELRERLAARGVALSGES